LQIMGFDRVFALDGGLKAWRGENRPLETGEVNLPPTTLTPTFRPALVHDLREVTAILETASAQIVDARGGSRFRGETPEPRAGLRSGHMPGAVNVPFDSLLGPDGRMKPVAALAAIFKDAGVDLDRPIVTSCGSGVTASVLALALARLGREDVAVYDGSWTEWGGRPDTLIVAGP
jgi:thiosulfate/3-mercaptopyruvate sulfurtransferase